jgi:hypothetical protein
MHTCIHDNKKGREKLIIHRTLISYEMIICLTILRKGRNVEMQLAGN